MGQWRYCSTALNLGISGNWMGQLQASALYPGTYSIEPRFLCRRDCNLGAIPTELSWLLTQTDIQYRDIACLD
jgi:hypothetical protein